MLATFIMVSLVIFHKTVSNGLLTKIFGFSALTVGSGSMETELFVGDVIIIKKCEDYEVGDIVTYNVNNEYLVTHRIIQKNREGFVTKGDNNNMADAEMVTKENIEGKVIYKTRLLKWIYNHWIIVFLIILAVLILW